MPLAMRLARLLRFAVLALALQGCPATLADQASLEDRQRELKSLQSAVAKLQKQLQDKRGRKAAALKKFSRAEKAIGELGATAFELQQQQASLAAKLGQLQRELRETTRRQEAQRSQVAQYLRAAYQGGRVDVLAILFSDASPADLDRQLHYLQQINRQRNALIAGYSELLQQKKTLLRQVDLQVAKNREHQEKIDAQQRKLASAQRERGELLARLGDEIGTAEGQLAGLVDTQAEMQKLVETMGKALQQAPRSAQGEFIAKPLPGKFAAARGQLPWPVAGAAPTAFGRTNTLSGVKSQGVSIAAESGTAVQAIYPGEVIFADWFGGQGLLAIVDHGEGYWSLYGRNQSLLKPVGARVSAGEAIATVGNSGGRSESALYFEIRSNGVPANPADWCR